MKRVWAIFLVTVCVACGVTSCRKPRTTTTSEENSGAGTAKRIYIAGVPNAAQVDEHLYRGAQPRRPGVQALKELGVTTIVDLRDEEKSKIARERKTAEGLGMRFVNIPVNGWAAPSDQQVAMFLEIFRDQPEQKVFVHCEFGEDRTGVFVATYRMAYDKYSVEEALREMNEFGFNHEWHRNMGAYVREFPAHLQSSLALAEFK
jgi:protein tyrosine/serine phosphatase